MADNKIRIDVAFNSQKAEQNAKNLSKALDEVKNTMEQTAKTDLDIDTKTAEKSAKKLSKSFDEVKNSMKDISGLKIDASKAEKELKQVEKELERYQKKLNEAESGKLGEYNKEYERITSGYESDKAAASKTKNSQARNEQLANAEALANQQIDNLNQKYAKVLEETDSYYAKIQQCKDRQQELTQAIEQAREKQAQQNALVNKASGNFDAAKNSANRTKNEVKKTANEAQKASKKTRQFSGNMKNSEKNAKKTKSETQKIKKNVSDFSTKAKKFAATLKSSLKPAESMRKKFTKIGIALLGARSAFMLFKQMISSAMDNNEKLQNQLTAAKGVLGEALAPAISLLVNLLSKAVTFADMIYQTFTGTSLIAKYNAKQAEKTASATEDAAKAAKEYKNQMASFDVANKLSDNSSSSSSSSGNSGSNSENPMFESVPIDDWLKDILDEFESKDFTGMGKKIAEKISQGLAVINWDDIKSKAFSGGKSFAEVINGMFAYTDKDGQSLSESLGKSLGEALNTAVQAGLGFVTTFNWSKNGKELAKGFNKWVDTVDWDDVGDLIGDSVKGILEGIDSYIKNIDGDKVGKSLGKVIKNIDWGGIIIDLMYIITDSLKLLFDTVTGLMNELGSNPDELTAKSKKFFNDLAKWAKTSLLPMLLSFVKAVVSIMKNDKTINEAILQGLYEAIFGEDSSDEAKVAAEWTSFLTRMLNPITSGFSITEFIRDKLFGKDKDNNDDSKESDDDTDFSFTVGLSGKTYPNFDDMKQKWDSIKEKGKNALATIKGKIHESFKKLKSKWDSIRQKGKTALAKIRGKIYESFKKAKKKWDSLRNKVNWATIKGKLHSSFKKAKKNWKSITNKANTVVMKVKDGITNAIKKILASLCSMVNKVIGVLNKILPRGMKISTVSPPKLARGGIVNNPGRGVTATVGEAGTEAILPLENNTGWMDLLAERIANRINANGEVLQTIITLDGETIAKKISQVNGRRNIRMNGGVV